jgi:hypothetical protein
VSIKGKIGYLGMGHYRIEIDTGNEDGYDLGFVYMDDIIDELGWRDKEVLLATTTIGKYTVLGIVGPAEEE